MGDIATALFISVFWLPSVSTASGGHCFFSPAGRGDNNILALEHDTVSRHLTCKSTDADDAT